MRPFTCCSTILALLVVTTCYAQPDTQQDKPTLSIVDLIDVPALGSVQVSPDGSQILYVRTDADWEANKTVSHIWRVNSDGSGDVQMTNGENGESGAIWSPDGARIAFVAKRGDDENNQIWLIPNTGGEAVRLSDHPTGVTSLSWSPDGARIYFRATDEKSEEEQRREKIKDNVYRYDEDKRNAHLWVIEVESGEEQRLTDGEFSVRGYNLSLDGSLIAYERAPTPLLDDGPRSEIWVVPAGDTTGGRQITSNSIQESGAQLSPDNGSILFWANTDDDLTDFYYNDRLFVVSVEGGTPECVVCGGEFDVGTSRWSSDGSAIYFRANTGVRSDLYRVSIDDHLIEPVTHGDHSLVNWDFEPRAAVHAISFTSPADPGEIRMLDAGATAPRQVTHVFDYVAEKFVLPEVRLVHWKGEDGVEVEGLVFLPIGYVEGQRYPLVVQTHGGPASSDQFRFPRSINYETVLASMGYVVFKPNYRGSTGYGDDFLRDMVGHYFHEAHKDVMTGVDHLIEIGIADGDRMAKMGWSAGGHMTNKIITYTDRFKAASSGAGAIDWVSMYAQSDIRTYRTPWFGGDPWSEDSPIDQYMADSPLFDVYKVTTPTIVLVGEDDPRVPMPQSVELYRALKRNGVPTHLYVAPAQGHGWRELQQRLFKANVELDWFERWVMGRTYVWEASPVAPEE